MKSKDEMVAGSWNSVFAAGTPLRAAQYVRTITVLSYYDPASRPSNISHDKRSYINQTIIIPLPPAKYRGYLNLGAILHVQSRSQPCPLNAVSLQKVIARPPAAGRHMPLIIRNRRENAKLGTQILVYRHDGRNIAASIAVVWRRPHRHHRVLLEVILATLSACARSLCPSDSLPCIPH